MDPLDLLIAIGRARRWLVLWPLLASLVAAGVSLVLPKSYTATTRILPPQQGASTAAMLLSQFGGLAGPAGGALGVKSPSDLHIRMLTSDAVADALIERFGLRERYGQEFMVDTRKALAGDTSVQADKSGLITIDVEAESPQLAADLANGYVAEFHRLTSTLAVTEAAQRRLFFERHLQQAKDRLASAEVALRQAIDQGGLVSVEAQSRATVETSARLQAEISAREVQLEAMRAYATPVHPEVRRAERELESMRATLVRLESGPSSSRRSAAGAPAEAGGPADGGVGNIKLVRELKHQEILMELLVRQYEAARVDESKEAPLVQVLDAAKPPEKRSSPKRTRLVLVSAAGALLAAVLAALVKGGIEHLADNPGRAPKLAEARTAWRWRAR
jgi:uncharacterized protein involved in exopolysaccharide biosynthesis